MMAEITGMIKSRIAMQLAKKALPYLKLSVICLLVGYSFWSIALQLREARQLIDTQGSYLSEWEKRFEPIKERLPFTHGVIGYAADWDIPGLDFDAANMEAEHVLTQYTLTPIVLSRNTSHEWILVNMDEANFDTWFAMQEGKFEVTKYKYNLYLLRRIK